MVDVDVVVAEEDVVDPSLDVVGELPDVEVVEVVVVEPDAEPVVEVALLSGDEHAARHTAASVAKAMPAHDLPALARRGLRS